MSKHRAINGIFLSQGEITACSNILMIKLGWLGACSPRKVLKFIISMNVTGGFRDHINFMNKEGKNNIIGIIINLRGNIQSGRRNPTSALCVKRAS